MYARKNPIATPRGFARMLARGIRANFAPDCQEAEIVQWAELFHDMAMSRSGDAEIGRGNPIEIRMATSDAAWLEEIADEFDEAALPEKTNL
jgi:hypothetical protein